MICLARRRKRIIQTNEEKRKNNRSIQLATADTTPYNLCKGGGRGGSAASAPALSAQGFGRARYGGDTVEITIAIKGKCCRVRALRDSGNTLRDPVRGQPVLVAETVAIAPIWDESTMQILCSQLSVERKMAQLSEKELCFTLLPYQCVGNRGGLMLAVRSDYLQIGKRTIPRALVALSDTPIGNGCHALWGGRESWGNLSLQTRYIFISFSS